MKAQNLSGLADYHNDLKESQYASNVREPLGASYSRGHNLPNKVDESEFKFGVPTVGSESAKNLVYPAGREKEEKPEVSDMYNKTHGAFGPGEQKNRNYVWPANQDRFGYAEQRVPGGAANSLHPERLGGAFPKTVIVKKTVEDFNAVQKDHLGASKNLGQGKPPVDPDQAFGSTRRNDEDWNAAMCLTGSYSDAEMQPDRDLGTCVKANCKNEVRRAEDSNRVFGAPSIRTDIPFKEKKSVADHQNYGDEPDAVDLLFPSTFTELGITEQDFSALRDRQSIKDLFSSIGYSYKIGKFNAMYNRALKYCNSPDDRCSVRAFMIAVKELDAHE